VTGGCLNDTVTTVVNGSRGNQLIRRRLSKTKSIGRYRRPMQLSTEVDNTVVKARTRSREIARDEVFVSS